MYLKLLSHFDKQSFPLLSERIDCIVAIVAILAYVAPTGASVDMLTKLAIQNVIANLLVIINSSFSYIPRIECGGLPE